MTQSKHSEAGLLGQEVVFSICMGLMAILGRGNPLLRYPQILWAFGVFLCFNGLYHILLRRHADKWIVSYVSVAVNSLLVSLILVSSGGRDSQFWPMFLLPVFTACLRLEKRHVFLAVAIPAGFLSYFYLESFWQRDIAEAWSFFAKIAVLGFSAGITMHVSFRERAARKGLQESREKLDQMTRTFDPPVGGAGNDKIEQMIGGVLHGLNNPMTVILGSSQILRNELAGNPSALEDIERIQAAAQSCVALTTNLLAWTKPSFTHDQSCGIDNVVGHVMILFDQKMKRKNLIYFEDLPRDLPPVRISSVFLQQVLLSLLFAISDRMKSGGHFGLKAENKGDKIDLHVFYEINEENDSIEGLEQCRQILVNAGIKTLIYRQNYGMEFSFSLPVSAVPPPVPAAP